MNGAMGMKIESVWDFVSEWYPGYYQCQEIARLNDLDKIIDDEIEEEDSEAYRILMNEFNGFRQHAGLHAERNELTIYVYEEAIKNWIKHNT